MLIIFAMLCNRHVHTVQSPVPGQYPQLGPVPCSVSGLSPQLSSSLFSAIDRYLFLSQDGVLNCHQSHNLLQTGTDRYFCPRAAPCCHLFHGLLLLEDIPFLGLSPQLSPVPCSAMTGTYSCPRTVSSAVTCAMLCYDRYILLS